MPRFPRRPAHVRLLPPNAYLGWTPYAWLIYLATFFVQPAMERSAFRWMLCGVGTVVFLASYFRGHWLRGRALLPIIALETALGVVFTPMNAGAFVMFVYAASFAAQLERTREALKWMCGIYVVAIVAAWAGHVPAWAWLGLLVSTPLASGVNLHFARVERANVKRRTVAHAEIQHLAAVAERDRIARDLHDVMGHTLTLIVLKSQLASKLAETDPARAVKEIRDVEQVSRAALRDVREAILGYRPTLAGELACARTLLDAAEITLELDIQDLTWAAASEEVIALAVREAVTNVVRHSNASHARIRIWRGTDGDMLEVSDNGKAVPSPEGNGLRGMRERVESLGGAVTHAVANGMRLTIALPVGART